MTIAKIITRDGATVYLKGKAPFVMASNNKYYPALIEALNTGEIEEVLKVIDMANAIQAYAKGNITVNGGEILYKGEVLTGALVDRILQFIGEGINADNLIKFLENLMDNPSYQSRQELYLFLEACGDLPITEDGRFIAYKWVRDDYKDVHSGTFDNSVGQIVKMARLAVDDNRQNTCSAGLHVCSSKYSKFGSRLMLVAINPRDVVSVPYDYDNGKMRVCEYEVVQELSEADYTQFQSAAYDVSAQRGNRNEDEGYDGEDEDEDE